MNKVQARLIDELMEREDRLSDWERKFVDDLYNRDIETLTTNQNHKLNEIHHRVVFNS